MSLIPLLLFYLSLYLNQPKKLSRLWCIPAVFVTLIAVGFLTNDLHFQAFAFLEPVMHPNARKVFGPVYYLYAASGAVCAVSAFSVMLRKCRVTITKRFAWVPMVPLLLGVCLLILTLFDPLLRIRGIALWNMGEIFFFMALGFLESCIRIGLIPANTEYGTIFREIKIQARIYDMDGRQCFASGGEEALTASDHVRLERAAIHGGSVVWAVDVKELIALDRQLQEATEQIEVRNEYLRSENDLKEESTALAARNQLYDTVATLLKPQLDQIRLLLKEAREGDFTASLKKISVLNAYIKRRSNMALLLSDTPMLPLAELTLAMEESLSYLELCGVETLLTAAGNRELPGEMITLAYDFFEAVLESAPGRLNALSAAVTCPENGLTLRLMFSGDRPALSFRDWNREALERWRGHIETEEEDADTLITFRLERGGDGQC